MKKILVILMMFLSFSVFSQAEDYFPDRVKLGTTPTSNAIDNLITIDVDGVLNRSTVTLNNIGVGMFLPLIGGTLTGNLNVETSGNAEIKALRALGADTRITSQSSRGQIGTFSNHSLQFVSNSAARYEINENGNHDFKLGDALFGGNLTINGSFTNNNLRFTTSGSNAYIDNKTNGGDVYFRTLADDSSQDAQILMRGSEKDVSLHFNTVAKLRTNTNGVEVFGDITANSFIGDGSSLTNVAKLNTSNAFSQKQTIQTPSNNQLILRVDSGQSDDWNYIEWYGEDEVRDLFFGTDGAGNSIWSDVKNNQSLQLISTGAVLNGNNVFHEGNFGKTEIDALSVDAGTIDGLNSPQFLRSDVSDTFTGSTLNIEYTFPRINLIDTDSGQDDWSIINNNGSFGIYNSTDAVYELSIGSTQATFDKNVLANNFISDGLIVGKELSNETNSGYIDLLENRNGGFGSNAYGFRFNHAGDSNTLTLLGGNATTTNNIFSVGRDFGAFTFNRSIDAQETINLSAPNDVVNIKGATKTFLSFDTQDDILTINDKLVANKSTNELTWDGKDVLLAGNTSSTFYQEGTFTPTLTDAGGGATYSFTTLDNKFIRTGNSVYFNYVITGIQTTGTPSGNLILDGFPFAVDGSGSSCEISQVTGSNVNFYSIGAILNSSGEMRLTIQQSLDGTFNSPMTNVTFTNGVLYVSGTYQTNVYTP